MPKQFESNRSLLQWETDLFYTHHKIVNIGSFWQTNTVKHFQGKFHNTLKITTQDDTVLCKCFQTPNYFSHYSKLQIQF